MNLKGINIPVLSYLSEKKFITGRELSNQFGISRVAVWKQIQKLKKLGYIISADNKKGYRIVSSADILLPHEIYRNLHTKYIGKQIFYYNKVTSTNSMAKETIKDKKDYFQEGTVIIADIQTAGRGRLGRTWYSPLGGIWLTIVLFPNLEPVYISKITLMTAVVLVQSIRKLYDIPVQIKWPNDVVVKGKKLCGILTEMAAESDCINYVAVGIGVNANLKGEDFPKDVRGKSISLMEILEKSISRVKLVQLLLEDFEKYYHLLQQKQFTPILQEWKLNAETLGKNITILSAGQKITGKAIDITSEGALVIRKEGRETVNILSGTVQ